MSLVYSEHVILTPRYKVILKFNNLHGSQSVAGCTDRGLMLQGPLVQWLGEVNWIVAAEEGR